MNPSQPLAGLLFLGLALALPAAAQSPQPPGQQRSDDADRPPAISAERGEVPVFGVTALEVLPTSQITGVTMIVATGVVSSGGWGQASLIPLVRGTPSDGVLDLVLVAEPPSETMPASGFAPIMATLQVDTAHPYRAVRVRSANNVLAVRQMPGQAQVAAPQTDCHACAGHRLAPAGATAAADDIAPAALPPGTRIIRPEDGITDLQPNPNRLTLLLGEDGLISEAVWQ